ncbi:putative P-loop containing nucleoside triphosphate hydrolase [Rosa chinensis]|uniref:Putative P-loop containing nucleoside triphosphate hydrolase n=1 Tax=Rosa chinensis TaxID=74649 RepID=A0A2P6Q6Q5_ROSCH|nr:putative P-loop containing nucleoside triphosphate hydrolase [Rosa chinensis]
MASFVMDLLIGKLVTILENEGTTIAGVRDEVDKVKEEFLSMKAFLVDTEANKAKTEGEKLWVARIRDLTHDVEDIIDEFLYHMYEKRSGGRLSRGLHKTIRAPSNLWFRHKLANKLQKITEMIKAIPERNQRYSVGLVGGATTSEDIHKLVQNQAESSFFIMEDELVGIKGKKQILMGWLMDEEQHQTTISGVGMGGSGKTTLEWQLGSQIIVTTRKEDIASNSFGVESHVHHIQPLLRNEAWDLLCKKAFSSNEDKTCGLMSSKKSLDQWNKVLNSFNWHLHKNPLLDPVKNILLLSFNDLPSQLKHCFLYSSLFPEDFVIKRKRLIRLWIAEEFVEHAKGVTPEEVADNYLMELCFRTMLQVVERNGTGRPKKVKMHDLLARACFVDS